jgi:hypothetical protein
MAAQVPASGFVFAAPDELLLLLLAECRQAPVALSAGTNRPFFFLKPYLWFG